MVRTVGVVLAGGRSSRMGSDKAAVTVGGRTMLDHVAAALEASCGEVVVAGPQSTPGLRSIPDPGASHRGPLAGLAAACGEYPDAVLVVVAVDQPWVRPQTLRELTELTDDLPVLPVDGGIRQTTCAAYPVPALQGIDEELEAGGSIQSLVDRVSFVPVTEDQWSAWGEDGRSWYSADSMAAVQAGLERFGTP